MIPPRVGAAVPAERPFWPDIVAGVSMCLLVLGCFALRALMSMFGLMGGVYAPARQRDRVEHDLSSWIGLALLVVPFTIWACGELATNRTRGHIFGIAIGVLSIGAYATDRLVWGWLLLAPLPLYCAARLLGWGPRPQ